MENLTQDMLWKEMIRDFLKESMDFFAPRMSKLIDYDQGYIFLDKELNQIMKGKSRICDMLIKVTLKNNEKRIILINIEVQGYNDKDFANRMFEYYKLITLNYKEEVYGLAIFTNNNIRYMPNRYVHKMEDVQVEYKYKTYKVIIQNENQLKKSNNIFALVILAILYQIKEKDDQRKANFKKQLIKLLKERRYNKEIISRLFAFLDLVVKINDYQLRVKTYVDMVNIIEEDDEKMGDVLRIENTQFYKDLPKVLELRAKMKAQEEGRQEGIQKGIQEEKIKVAKKMLAQGFSIEQVSDITEICVKKLKKYMY